MEERNLLNRQQLLEKYVESMECERTRLGLTQAQMAKELDVSTSSYKKLIGGEISKIDLYLAYRLYHLSGKYICELCQEKNSEIEMLRLVSGLTEAQKRFVRDVIEFELNYAVTAEGEDSVTLMVPTGNFEDGMVWDSVDLRKVNVAAYRKRFGEDIHCAIMVNSNHLHPVYHRGDILLICQRAPRDGDTGIFINKETGRAYLRKFHQTNPCILEPVNEFGQSFMVNPDAPEDMKKWIKFGIVLAKMRE